ncbi:MAG: LTA synthase family protein [Clostridia bacterium]|nr:LTA synthase family protein [Clostridia bacterium]
MFLKVGICIASVVIILLFMIIEAAVLYKKEPVKKRLGFVLISFIFTQTICFLIQLISPVTNHFLYFEEPSVKKFIFAIVSSMCAVVAHLLIVLVSRKITQPEPELKCKKTFKFFGFFASIFIIAGLIIFFTSKFIISQWEGVRPEQLISNLFSPTEGTEISVYFSGIEYVVIALGFIISALYFCCKKFSFVFGQKRIYAFVKSIVCFVLSACFVVFSCVYTENNLHVSEIYKAYVKKSDFIERNYVDPKTAQIKFPETKRNLIYIYLESMENSYLSKDLGGYMETNLMPELTQLSYEGITFSNSDNKFGGPMQIIGTSWSLASLVNQNLGIPMKAPGKPNSYGQEDNFINGAYGLGEVLKDNGYNNSIVLGSDAHFGGLEYLFRLHGDYKIIDHRYAKENGLIPKDYKVFWGYEDDKLYKFAKDEAAELYEAGKPFNLVVETADTHMPDGYLPANAPKPYDSQYANAIAYATSQTVEFVRWIQQQPFYKNTTIILIGDHLSMAVKFFKDFDENYLRTQYNLIINPAQNVAKTDESRFKNRLYANFDMYPTTLAALGCEIKGDRLGLGTNLFSKKETLLEKYGMDYAVDELTKSSTFYNEKLLMDTSAQTTE